MPTSRKALSFLPWKLSPAAVAHRELLEARGRRQGALRQRASRWEGRVVDATAKIAAALSTALLLRDLPALDKEVVAGLEAHPGHGVLIAAHAADTPIINGNTSLIYIGLQVSMYATDAQAAMEILVRRHEARFESPIARPLVCTRDDPTGSGRPVTSVYAVPEGRNFAYDAEVSQRILAILERNPDNDPRILPNLVTAYLFYTPAGWRLRDAEAMIEAR